MREKNTSSRMAAMTSQILKRRRGGPTSMIFGFALIGTWVCRITESVLSVDTMYNPTGADSRHNPPGTLSHRSPARAGWHGSCLRGDRSTFGHHGCAERDVVHGRTSAQTV